MSTEIKPGNPLFIHFWNSEIERLRRDPDVVGLLPRLAPSNGSNVREKRNGSGSSEIELMRQLGLVVPGKQPDIRSITLQLDGQELMFPVRAFVTRSAAAESGFETLLKLVDAEGKVIPLTEVLSV